jgi:hypothetical protein
MFLRSAAYAFAACVLAGLQQASAVEVAKPQQILAETISAGCTKWPLKKIAVEQRPDFCKCVGEQAATSFTPEDLRSKEAAKAVLGAKTQSAARLCGALFKK